MTADRLWEEYRQAAGLDDGARYSESFHFELTEYWANELLRLVLEGKKKATSSSLIGYELEGDQVPEEGEYSIITDWAGNARCVIRTVRVRIIPFNEMTFEICRLEGEDDCLQSWREKHISFFMQEGAELGYEFSETMPVIFEEFEVVYKADD